MTAPGGVRGHGLAATPVDPARARSFDGTAGTYDAARPPYPEELLTEVFERLPPGPGTRILDVGCGTGRLSVRFAERGAEVWGLEPGPHLAEIARERLSRSPGSRVLVTRFEDWEGPATPFDVVVSSTAFHWIERGGRARRAAELLRPGGLLVIIDTHQVVGGTPGFFEASQECYRRWDPGYRPDFRLPSPSEAHIDLGDVESLGSFRGVLTRDYPREIRYTTEEYLRVLGTYSDVRVIQAEAREAFLRCIGELIHSQFGGNVVKAVQYELRIFERVAEDPSASPAPGPR